jgi:organic hydroperoxide reductase OsmC/OhrA
VPIKVARAEVKGYFARSGSIAERTEQHRASSVEVNLEIESDAGENAIEELVWLAEDMCYVMQAVKAPVEATLNVSLNGRPLALTG